MATESGKSQSDIYWKSRKLCSDESCIGVIGPDGRCKECGISGNGQQPLPAEEIESPDRTEETADTFDPPSGETEDDVGESDDVVGESDDDWKNRILCSDGNCIGIIGSNGRCRECGKPFEKG